MPDKRRAAIWVAAAMFASLQASAALNLISASYPLGNVMFFAMFGLPLLIGLLSASWRALALIPLTGFLFLLVWVIEGSHIPVLAIVGVHVYPAVLYGPWLVAGVMLGKLAEHVRSRPPAASSAVPAG